jgi:hypothetical protein
MELSVATPGLLFPAISLMMLAHTNRFLALASLIRALNDRYRANPAQAHVLLQIKNLRSRLRMLRSTQALGVLSFLLCAVCIGCIMWAWDLVANIIFAVSLLSFGASLIISLLEIMLSLKALETDLQDMESGTMT